MHGCVVPSMPGLSGVPYLADRSLGDYLALMSGRHPGAARLLNFERPGVPDELAALSAARNEFESDRGGRGGSYRRAQVDADVRSRGILELLRMLAGDRSLADLPQDFAVLDVLGGDGVVARALGRRHPSAARPCRVVTGDIAAGMVQQAIDYGLPAIRQPAHFLFLHDACLDGVLIAYGSHHIPAGQRLAACREAQRVLRHGGRIVLHDFETGSPMATWFGDVVDRFTEAGHRYEHFTRASLHSCLEGAGFRDVTVHSIYDPFVVRASSEREAADRLVDYVLDMYGLRGRLGPVSASRSELWELLDGIFRYSEGADGLPPGHGRLRVRRQEGQALAELPRIAIVGTGRKDGD